MACGRRRARGNGTGRGSGAMCEQEDGYKQVGEDDMQADGAAERIASRLQADAIHASFEALPH